MSMEWFRWWHGCISDPKFTTVARRSKQPRAIVIALWAALLEHASQANPRGSIQHFCLEDAANLLEIDEDHLTRIMEELGRKGLIQDQHIARWAERQPHREDYSTGRVRRHRDMKRNETQKSTNETQCNANSDVVTQCNAPDTDTDADADTDLSLREYHYVGDVDTGGGVGGPCDPPNGGSSASAAPAEVVRPQRDKPQSKKARPDRSGKSDRRAKTRIPEHWHPSDRCLALIDQNKIPATFASSLVGEFVLYWEEQGEKRPGWDSTFLNHCKRSWDREKYKHQATAPSTINAGGGLDDTNVALELTHDTTFAAPGYPGATRSRYVNRTVWGIQKAQLALAESLGRERLESELAQEELDRRALAAPVRNLR